MTETRPKVILQAHATRAATALALILHANDRGPRDLKKPFGAMLIGLIIAIVIVVGVVIASRLGAVIAQKH